MEKYVILITLSLGAFLVKAQQSKEVLKKAVNVQAQSDEAGRSSQKKVNAYVHKTESDLREYKVILKQIENMKAYNEQMRNLIESQAKEMILIKEKMKSVANLKKEVLPLVAKMLDSIKLFVKLDVPFLKEERAKRIVDLDALMVRADVSTSEKFRRVLEAYQIENEYGRTIEAYNGKVISPLGDELSVEFLRVGRLSLMYRGLDGKSFGRWDKVKGKFVNLERAYKSALKNGLKVAKKQKAPTLLTVPVVKSEVEG